MAKNLLLILIAHVLFSCQKEMSSEVGKASQVDVYVAGYIQSDTTYDNYPTYWKNGQAVQLDFDYGLKFAWANSIAVSGNDVYVAGFRVAFSFYRSSSSVGLYWKNSTPTELFTGGFNQLTSVVVSNKDVYMVVLQNMWPGAVAAYLKNGEIVYLQDGSESSTAVSMAVSGSDVYVVGLAVDQNGHGKVRYWKNGNPVDLTDGSTSAYPTSIFVSESDVYVAGRVDQEFDSWSNLVKSTAAYWKNGKLVKLTDGTNMAEATSVTVAGQDVYVAGYHCGIGGYEDYTTASAFYWKNGSPIKLSDGPFGGTLATSIAVSNSDVYVAGITRIDSSYYTPLGVPTYWKNGVPVNLTETSRRGAANSIFLAPH